jgi:hypothetical protein
MMMTGVRNNQQPGDLEAGEGVYVTLFNTFIRQDAHSQVKRVSPFQSSLDFHVLARAF